MKDRFFEMAIPIDELSGGEQADIYCGSDEFYVEKYNIFIEEKCETKNEDLQSDLVDFIGSQIDCVDTLFVFDDGTLVHNDYDFQWEKFIQEISYSKRFFNNEAYEFIDRLFEHIHVNGIPNADYIEVLQPETELYRARKCNDKSARESIIGNPSLGLGPVPRHLSTNQRMTPTGISSLYCALDRGTCLSELRPVAGDTIISGGFSPIKELKLLVLSNIAEKSNTYVDCYHENYRDLLHRLNFIRKLTNLLSRPSINGGSLDYLSTQYVFEYFRIKFEENIDGVIYDSVQNKSGQNVVLFPHEFLIENFKYDCEKEAIATEYDFSKPDFHMKPYRWYSVKLEGQLDVPDVVDDSDHPFIKPVPKFKLQFVEGSLITHKIETVKATSKDKEVEIRLSSKSEN